MAIDLQDNDAVTAIDELSDEILSELSGGAALPDPILFP